MKGQACNGLACSFTRGEARKTSPLIFASSFPRSLGFHARKIYTHIINIIDCYLDTDIEICTISITMRLHVSRRSSLNIGKKSIVSYLIPC